LNEGKYWEIVYNKNELKFLKRQINETMEKYREPEESLHRFSKIEILRNLSAYMRDFVEVIDFSIDELLQQQDIFNQ